MYKKRQRILAILTACLMLHGLAEPALAAPFGLQVTVPAGGTVSTKITGQYNGYESIESRHQGVGGLISDEAAAGESGYSVTFSGGTDVMTTGDYGGAALKVLSADKPVTVGITGETIRLQDQSDFTTQGVTDTTGAAGIYAIAQTNGKISLTSRADVEAVSRSDVRPGSRWPGCY